MKRAPGATVVEVVVVDDDERVRSIWRRCLDPPEFVVRPAGNEDEATAALRQAPADVVIVALGAAGASAETIDRLKREQPGLEVVAMTAPEIDAEEAQRVVDAGVFGVIAAPIASDLAAAVTVRSAAKHARLVKLLRRREAAVAELQSSVVMVAPEMASHREWSPGKSSYAALKDRALSEFDRAYVRSLLAHTQGNISRAARLAGLDRSNFRRIMKRSRTA